MFVFEGNGFITGIRTPGSDRATPDRLRCLENLRLNYNKIYVDCVAQGTPTRRWFRNGVEVNNPFYTLEVDLTNPGNFSCVLENDCGTSVYPAIISGSMQVYSLCLVIFITIMLLNIIMLRQSFPLRDLTQTSMH